MSQTSQSHRKLEAKETVGRYIGYYYCPICDEVTCHYAFITKGRFLMKYVRAFCDKCGVIRIIRSGEDEFDQIKDVMEHGHL